MTNYASSHDGIAFQLLHTLLAKQTPLSLLICAIPIVTNEFMPDATTNSTAEYVSASPSLKNTRIDVGCISDADIESDEGSEIRLR